MDTNPKEDIRQLRKGEVRVQKNLNSHKKMNMVVSEIRLYELLKARIGEKEAEAFVEILEKKVQDKFEDKKSELATKEDLSNLRSELLRTIYLTSLGQLFAIIASVVSLVLILKK